MTKEELEQPVTLGLLSEYTDTFLIPRMAEIMDSKINTRLAEHEYRLKYYMDKKFATLESDLTKRYDRRYVLKSAS